MKNEGAGAGGKLIKKERKKEEMTSKPWILGIVFVQKNFNLFLLHSVSQSLNFVV